MKSDLRCIEEILQIESCKYSAHAGRICMWLLYVFSGGVNENESALQDAVILYT